MTDADNGDERIDLSAIEPHESFGAVEDRIIAGALRAHRNAGRERVMLQVHRIARPLLVAAAVVLAIALGVIARERRAPEITDVLAEWVEAGHVPSNGELLLAFQGYVQ